LYEVMLNLKREKLDELVWYHSFWKTYFKNKKS
jgi:hypothetical protein